MNHTKNATTRAQIALFAALALALLLPISAHSAGSNRIEAMSGPHSELGSLCVQTGASGWSVKGRLRLLPDPLRHSDPGQVVLEAVAPGGKILAATNATIYRVVTANPRARLFGFRGALSDGFPSGAVLRIRHLAAER